MAHFNNSYPEETGRGVRRSHSSTPLNNPQPTPLSILELTNQRLFGSSSSAAVQAQGSRRGSLRPGLDQTFNNVQSVARPPALHLPVPQDPVIMDAGELERALMQSVAVTQPTNQGTVGSTVNDEYCEYLLHLSALGSELCFDIFVLRLLRLLSSPASLLPHFYTVVCLLHAWICLNIPCHIYLHYYLLSVHSFSHITYQSGRRICIFSSKQGL